MSIDISSSVSIAKRRLNDLQSFQLPRLRQCKGPIGLFREIADEMKSDIEGVRRSIEVCSDRLLLVIRAETRSDEPRTRGERG